MTDVQLAITDPRPQRYLTDAPGVGGTIKARPDDFMVDEQPLYEPCGSGEHLYLHIEKVNVSHGEMMAVLQKHFNVDENAIGFAGMKDKHAVTRQLVSIYLPRPAPPVELAHDRIRVLWSDRHTNKLRRGHLAGNRFVIRIREVDPMQAPQALKTLRQLERAGVPNYFGFQRFGYRLNNHKLGAMYLAGQWQAALDELLGSTGSPYPEYQQPRRELYDAGQYDDAAALWTASDRTERTAINALRKTGSPRDAMLAIGRTALNFWVSALQSAIFNRVLDVRIDAGTLGVLEDGDLAWKHDSGAVFAVTAREIGSGELPPRLERLEISPSGPLWGRSMTRADGEVGQRELDALHAAGLQLSDFNTGQVTLRGARRPLRVPITDGQLDAGVDEHGPFIRLAFDLPRGAYATIALREIMKSPGAETSPDAAESRAD